MQWNVSQNSDTLTGSVTLSDPARSMMGGGSMTGTLNGQMLSFHLDIPSGGFGGALASCTVTLDGQATLSADGKTMTGTYTGVLSGTMSGAMAGQPCGGSMSNGHFTLTH